jgi:hypothetical protein
MRILALDVFAGSRALAAVISRAHGVLELRRSGARAVRRQGDCVN